MTAAVRATPDAPARDAADVFRALAPAVHGYLRSAGAADPEDLLGDVFVAVTAGLARFDGDEAALRRWVFTIAHHKLVDERRRAARRRRLRLPFGRDAGAPDEPFDPALVAALARLTAEQRETVMLRFVADLPLDAVAAITGRPIGAVKALQHRGLAQLGRLLRDYEG